MGRNRYATNPFYPGFRVLEVGFTAEEEFVLRPKSLRSCALVLLACTSSGPRVRYCCRQARGHGTGAR